MRPVLLRPPFLVSGRTSDFSGVERVTSTKSATDEPRRPGVVGLYLRIAMVPVPYLTRLAAEDINSAITGNGDDRSLDVLALAQAETRATRLALAVDRVHGRDLDTCLLYTSPSPRDGL